MINSNSWIVAVSLATITGLYGLSIRKQLIRRITVRSRLSSVGKSELEVVIRGRHWVPFVPMKTTAMVSNLHTPLPITQYKPRNLSLSNHPERLVWLVRPFYWLVGQIGLLFFEFKNVASMQPIERNRIPLVNDEQMMMFRTWKLDLRGNFVERSELDSSGTWVKGSQLDPQKYRKCIDLSLRNIFDADAMVDFHLFVNADEE